MTADSDLPIPKGTSQTFVKDESSPPAGIGQASVSSPGSNFPFPQDAPPTPSPPPLGKMTIEQGFFQSKARALTKLAIFLAIILIFGTTSTVLVTKFFTDQVRRITKGVLYSVGLKQTIWQSFGSVPEAELELTIKTAKGEIVYPFLLDTGAVVSSLPREMADTMGYNLAFLPRQTFKGFGNTTSFAYQAEMNVQFGKREVHLPVVFTEAGGSRALLGRKGLFDKFSIVVDHENKVVEIRE